MQVVVCFESEEVSECVSAEECHVVECDVAWRGWWVGGVAHAEGVGWNGGRRKIVGLGEASTAFVVGRCVCTGLRACARRACLLGFVRG